MAGGPRRTPATRSASERPATAHVALLRGINVGGKHILPMKDLAAIFSAAGCTDVITYIQSGNVVFDARAALARGLPAAIAAAILSRFGHRVPVILRSAGELDEIVQANPFVATGADPATLHVAFLAAVPDAARLAALDPHRSPRDELAAGKQELYLRLRDGVGRTKLTSAYLDATLATTSTLRNWRTVLALRDLSRR